MDCPFCKSELKLETVETGKAIMIMFCDNEDCAVKPCTGLGCPSQVIEEAKLLGRIEM